MAITWHVRCLLCDKELGSVLEGKSDWISTIAPHLIDEHDYSMQGVEDLEQYTSSNRIWFHNAGEGLAEIIKDSGSETVTRGTLRAWGKGWTKATEHLVDKHKREKSTDDLKCGWTACGQWFGVHPDIGGAWRTEVIWTFEKVSSAKPCVGCAKYRHRVI